jgi:glycosyltransferase involved in cell wall biosynthesis
VIIPNGFDTEEFRPQPESRFRLLAELRLPEGALLVGRIGNYRAQKDYSTLISAFAQMARRNSRVHLVLIGTGVDWDNQSLVSAVASLSLIGRVHLLGERSDVRDILPGLDLFVSSSSMEGFPNVVGEAMASEVPTVATDAGDSLHLLGDPARIVPCRQPKLLAERALQLLALHPSERAQIGARDRARIMATYPMQFMVNEYVNLWHRCSRSFQSQ